MRFSDDSFAIEFDERDKREWKFVAVLVLVVSAWVLPLAAYAHEWVPLPDNPFQPGKIPYWCAVAGTLAGAIGASSPSDITPDSKWRDRLSLIGWVVLLFGSLFALFYGLQLDNDK